MHNYNGEFLQFYLQVVSVFLCFMLGFAVKVGLLFHYCHILCVCAFCLEKLSRKWSLLCRVRR